MIADRTNSGHNISKLDRFLGSAGQILVTFGALMVAFGIVGHSLRRPMIANAIFSVGIAAFGVLAVRRQSVSPVRSILTYSVFGAATGAYAYAVGWSLATHSWRTLVALLLVSVAIGFISFRYAGRNEQR
jgi:hypothetical protein